MELSNLKPNAGSTHKTWRKGRGTGSGNGKTAGYGNKGQKARSGAPRPGFEGGQMPLYRRLPKRGFTNVWGTVYSTVNVSDLNGFEKDSVVDLEALVECGLLKKVEDGLKVLGNGDLNVALTVRANKFSKSAVEKIEKAGGKAEVI